MLKVKGLKKKNVQKKIVVSTSDIKDECKIVKKKSALSALQLFDNFYRVLFHTIVEFDQYALVVNI